MRPGNHAVEAGLEQEAPPGRGIRRHATPRQRMISDEQQPGDQRARRDQGHRRDRRHADLDEGVGRAPQRREHSSSASSLAMLGGVVGTRHVVIPVLIRFRTGHLQAGRHHNTSLTYRSVDARSADRADLEHVAVIAGLERNAELAAAIDSWS